METTAADRAMPGPDAEPRSPAMRKILDANWFRDDVEGRLRRHEACYVLDLPKCDFCDAVADFDGATTFRGVWGYMCVVHFAEHGRGLGLGIGQQLLLRVA